mmetsp:Transcript_16257/g.40042  ORF Transcript_16257/g.40042 Transcript_16257/m.40042 type:complete len:101 (+) Transcript_16257:675-977(+)
MVVRMACSCTSQKGGVRLCGTGILSFQRDGWKLCVVLRFRTIRLMRMNILERIRKAEDSKSQQTAFFPFGSVIASRQIIGTIASTADSQQQRQLKRNGPC